MKRMSILIAALSALFSQEYTEFSGFVKADFRYFSENGLYPSQETQFVSLAVQPKFYMEWADGTQTLNSELFYRYDSEDENRTHGDVRELYWQYIADTWELSVGLKKIFWGVIETNHLVDVINQTDFVESFDGEEKLGQPMVHFSYPSDNYGVFDIFVLPYFRERVFPSAKGRLRFPFEIAESKARFESSDEEKHIDFSLRWSHSFDLLDIGIAHFSGTNREPTFSPLSQTEFAPYYALMEQTSVDAQLTTDAVLYKLELLRRESAGLTHTAASVGAEYTFGNISGSGTDIGILAEYHFDDRALNASIFDNDIFVGSRIALNDEQSTEFLLGGSVDLDHESTLFSVEGSRRFGDSWKANIELRIFTGIGKNDPVFAFRNDSFAQLTLAKYF